jgi:hypothetical protein
MWYNIRPVLGMGGEACETIQNKVMGDIPAGLDHLQIKCDYVWQYVDYRLWMMEEKQGIIEESNRQPGQSQEEDDDGMDWPCDCPDCQGN